MANEDREFLREIALARRWCVSNRTLQRWRQNNEGPRWLKIGGRILYRLTDVLAFEAEAEGADLRP